MNNLKAKLKKQGGFTLIEMLIVVAIIAILIAVSIPLVNSSLERAREATDAANERSFKAVLLISYTVGEYEEADGGTGIFTAGTNYTYDAANGVLAAVDADLDPYGKSTEVSGADNTPRTDYILYGTVTTAGQLQMVWAPPSSTPNYGTNNLIAPELVTNS